MIESLRGELLLVTEDSAVIECAGVGYAVQMPSPALSELPSLGCEVRLHTHMSVSEDAIRLFGFFTRDELNMFRMIISVSGIGPKVGLGVMSALSPDELRFAILSDDVKAICKAPGIGKKGAQKLILELKDKFDVADALDRSESGASAGVSFHGDSAALDAASEAVQALISLGYSSTDAFKAVRSLELSEDATVEQILKEALKKMAFL